MKRARALKRLCLALVLSLTIIVPLVPRITLQTVWSNPATIIVPDDYPKIYEAIDHANCGDTIFVRKGTYYEHMVVDKSNLTLIGEDGDATIIDGNGTGIIIRITASYVSISNFTIRNAGPKYDYAELDSCICGCGLSVQNITVENNILQNAMTGMVFCNGVSSIFIDSNTISNTVGYAIDIGGGTSPTATNVTISNNFIHDNEGMGISMDGETSNCNIINNTVENGYTGIDLGSNAHTFICPVNNLIEGNTLTNNSANLLIVEDNQSRPQETYTNIFRKNNLTAWLGHNLVVWSLDFGAFMQDIDTSNTANGKKVYYLTNRSGLDFDPSSCPDAAELALVNCTDCTVRDFDFTGNKDGLVLARSTNCTLANVTLADNRQLIIAQNLSAYSDYGGLTMFESTNNAIANSRICNNTDGVSLYHSDNNRFHHNSFVNNGRQVFSDCYLPFHHPKYQNLSSGYFSACNWNNGHEGNYWSDYNGTDSNGDGIGNTPYFIDANNTDHYPLMSPYSYWSNPAACDLNRDMKIDMKDVGYVARRFMCVPEDPLWDPSADVNGDGKIDLVDIDTVARHFGEYESKIQGTQNSLTIQAWSDASYSFGSSKWMFLYEPSFGSSFEGNFSFPFPYFSINPSEAERLGGQPVLTTACITMGQSGEEGRMLIATSGASYTWNGLEITVSEANPAYVVLSFKSLI